MRKTVYGAAGAACLASLLAQAADQPASSCTYREEPVVEPAPAGGASKKDKTRVTLMTVSPTEGTEVRANSVLELDVEYHLAGFAPDKFFLIARFPTVALTTMSPGDRDDYHHLTAPSGKVHLCVPLEEVYQHAGMSWPLSFVVSINEEEFSGRSSMLMDSRKVQLNSVDVPAGALELQAKAMPEEVQRALMMVFGYIEQQGAMNKLCPSRFADLQGGYTKTYRAWESRNAATIRQIQEMQYELLRDTMSTPAGAAKAFDATRDGATTYFSALENPVLRTQCTGMMKMLADETGDLKIATAVNLEVVQEYLASKQKTAVIQ